MSARKNETELTPDSNSPPPGLDANKHAQAQRQAAKVEIIRDKFICVTLMNAIASGKEFDLADIRGYLDGLLAGPRGGIDPIQQILIEQVGFAHLRLSELQLQAAQAKSVDGQKVLNSACARLLAEIRRTALAIAELRGSGMAPAVPKVKLAQTG